ncbi:MAG: DinB family protein [Terriglobales bacterium]|jgi:uncharacterized damage-inducible protein DinB
MQSFRASIGVLLLFSGSVLLSAQNNDIPTTIADSVGGALKHTQARFVEIAEAMPESKYSFIPTAGNFKDARSFAEQVKHVACANAAFFNEIEGKTPPAHCERGGPSPATTKAELLKYLHESFDYGNRVLVTVNAQNALDRVEGGYAAPNTKLGVAVAAVWHVTDHYGQLVEYLRMNGIVPPSTQRYGLPVR